MAVERIVQHKHCVECGRAVPTDKKFCAPQCETDYTTRLKKKNMVLLLNYGIIGILLLVLIFVY